ncbi:MAG: hypothetical protein WDO74_04635 [Pseudomonadota bacterium]
MALYTAIYYGYFDHCRPWLTAKQRTYWTKDENPAVDKGKPVDVPDPKKYDGIVFGQMQRACGKFAFVKVDDIILPVAVEHNPERHGPAPDKEWLTLTDTQAANILVDSIIANHLLRDELGRKMRGSWDEPQYCRRGASDHSPPDLIRVSIQLEHRR